MGVFDDEDALDDYFFSKQEDGEPDDEAEEKTPRTIRMYTNGFHNMISAVLTSREWRKKFEKGANDAFVKEMEEHWVPPSLEKEVGGPIELTLIDMDCAKGR